MGRTEKRRLPTREAIAVGKGDIRVEDGERSEPDAVEWVTGILAGDGLSRQDRGQL